MSKLKNKLISCAVSLLTITFANCKKGVTDDIIVITSFSPAKGAQGNEVSIKGSGFGISEDAIKVFFNGTEAIIASVTDTMIKTIVPPAATTGKISISAGGRSAISNQEFVILPGTWTRKSDLPGSGRILASAFSVGNSGYAGIGFANDGNGAGPTLNDWWQYDPILDQWIQKGDYPGGKRSNSISFVINNIGYVGTGWDDARNRKKDIWSYDPNNNQWTRKADLPGAERIDAVGFGIGNKAYAGTGDALVGPTRINLKDWWEYDPASDTWTPKSDFPSDANQNLAGFVIQNKLYIGLGRSSSPINSGKEWWLYDPPTDQWIRKADFPNPGNSVSNCSFVIENKGYILCYNGRAQFWQYDPATDQWKEQAFFDPNRMSSIGFAINNKGYLATGVGGPPQWPNLWTPATKDIWQFTPSQ